MPKTHLTDLIVRNLKPAATQTTYWDTASAIPGFNVRVSQRGTKTFTIVVGAERRRITLGRYPTLSLQDARKKAQRLIAEETINGHFTSVSFEDALKLFLTTHCKQLNKPRTASGTERLLRRHFGHFCGRRLDGIGIPEVNTVIDALLDTPSEANHAFVALMTFFNWCLRRGLLRTHPLLAQHKPAKCVSRDRVLSDMELLALARVRSGCFSPFHQILLLLLLTGQRRGEIAGLKWTYINAVDRTVTLPAVLTKNNREHKFPYGDAVAGVFGALPQTTSSYFRRRRTRADLSQISRSQRSSSTVSAHSRIGPCMTYDGPSRRSWPH